MTTIPQSSALVTRSPVQLSADSGRVITAVFVPGEELPEDFSRARAVLTRVMALTEDQVRSALDEVMAAFDGRHRYLREDFLRHFQDIASRIASDRPLSEERRLLIGAYFTREQSPEGAALTNPSIVAHPDQTGLQAGELRFVLSLRAVGEGHISCVEFRTGVVDSRGGIRMDPPNGMVMKGIPRPIQFQRAAFEAQLGQLGALSEIAYRLLDALGPTFDKAAMLQAILALDHHHLRRAPAQEMVDHFHLVAANNYEVGFPPETALDERVLAPTGPAESHGIEDARFVRLVDNDGSCVYYATYTAYNGRQVAPHLLQTEDFLTFQAHQLSGPAARNKGMAVFPRRIGGRYRALSRWDRENISVTASYDMRSWGFATNIQAPKRPWELIQLGNCGSPIETSEGWLMLTHGVGAMRTYGIGATLLDLDDPTRVIGALAQPLLRPTADERRGYVPNVVYTCGALAHGDLLVLPYGFGDQAVGFATVDLPELLKELRQGD